MKKILVNVGLFLAGYILISFSAFLFYLIITGAMVDILPKTDSFGYSALILFSALLMCLAAGIGVNILKVALKESVRPWVVLKKGDPVLIRDIDVTNSMIRVKLYPFTGQAELIEINSEDNVDLTYLKIDFKYFWNGKGFDSVIDPPPPLRRQITG